MGLQPVPDSGSEASGFAAAAAEAAERLTLTAAADIPPGSLARVSLSRLGGLQVAPDGLVRNDPIAEAVSFPRAIQTQAWTSSSAQNGREPIYNVDHLNWCLAKLIEQKNGWSRFFQQRRFIPDCVIRRVVRCSLASNERDRRLSRLSPDTGPNNCSSRHAQTVRRGECRMD